VFVKFLILALLALLLFGGGAKLAKLNGPKSLNLADRLLGGRDDVKQLADGQPYGRGPRQSLDIWSPLGPQASLPVVIFFYGGGWTSGERADYGFVGRALARKGFLVVIPDVRHAPKAHWPDFIEDGAAAFAWARRHIASYGGDPDRIALMGHSAGAYNAAMLALDEKWLRRAGSDAAYVRGVAGLAGPYDFLPMTKGGMADIAMGRVRPATNTQPTSLVRADAPPFFLASGTDDDVVRPRNSQALARALDDIGGKAVYKSYSDMGHRAMVMALAEPFRGRGAVLSDTAEFLHAVTAPHPTDEIW
jgi:acetyl esterase/lipase